MTLLVPALGLWSEIHIPYSTLQGPSFWKGIWSSGTIVACWIFCGGQVTPICGQVFLSARIAPTCSCSRTPQTQVGGLVSKTSISPARGFPCAPTFRSTIGSFLQCFIPCRVFYLLCGIVWWRCTLTTPQPWRTFRSRVALGLRL